MTEKTYLVVNDWEYQQYMNDSKSFFRSTLEGAKTLATEVTIEEGRSYIFELVAIVDIQPAPVTVTMVTE